MSVTALTDVISFRAPHALKEKIDRIVEKTKRSKSDLLVHWLEEALTLEEWQLREVELGIQEANAGKFATQEKVNQVLKKWL
jgi:RHH-type rel operon transcriptional repressor/antitoxin RelB